MWCVKIRGENLYILGASREEINRSRELFFVLSEALSSLWEVFKISSDIFKISSDVFEISREII